MSIDYYSVLGLKRTCTKWDILNVFRKVVHDFGMDKLNDSDTNRRLIAFEAYDVLSDPFWRELYDQFGDIAIKSGIFIHNEEYAKRYSYHGDIFLTYKSIYGSTNPYAHIMSTLSIQKATPVNVKKPMVERIPVYLTLNEIFFGTIKHINVSKNDGTQCIVNLRIPKGLPNNSEIVRNFTDDRTVVFIAKDLLHKNFVRSGQDLISTYNVTFKEMMCGVQYVINTLDNKQLRVNITQVITPTYQKIIKGEGMPIYGDSSDKRGNLILKFEIKVPDYLPISNDEICTNLSESLSESNLYKN